MPDDRASDPLQGMTAKEQQLLRDAMKRMEDNLYSAVLGRLTRAILIAVALFVVAVVGIAWLSWTTVRRSFAEDAAQILQSDGALHAELLAGLDIDTAALGARLREAIGQMDLPSGTGQQPISDADLTAMRDMIDQLLGGAEPVPKGSNTSANKR